MKSPVEYRPIEIVQALEEGFGQIYKPFAKYQLDKSELWKKCVSFISDPGLLDKTLFCNDHIQIPPAKVFLSVTLSAEEAQKLTAYDKKFIGSFFSYIFTTIFCYRFKKKIGINNPHLKTAMYFYDRAEDIAIVADAPAGDSRESGTISGDIATGEVPVKKRRREVKDV